MKLYEITRELEQFHELVENGEIPPEAIADTLSGIQFELEEKADNIACMIKNLSSEAEAVKAEAEKLVARAKSKEKAIEFYKKYLAESLAAAGITSVESARCVISFRKSEKVIVTDANTFAQAFPDLCTTKTTVSPDKTKIKMLLKDGVEIKGAYLEQARNIQIK